MPFPLLKLVSVFVKRRLAPLSEAVQKVIEKKAVKDTRVKKICTVPADMLQKYDAVEFSKRAEQAPIGLDKRIFVGADILAEALFWASFGFIMYLEYKHASKKAKRKEEHHREQYRALEREINNLKCANDDMVMEIRQLKKVIGNLTVKMSPRNK